MSLNDDYSSAEDSYDPTADFSSGLQTASAPTVEQENSKKGSDSDSPSFIEVEIDYLQNGEHPSDTTTKNEEEGIIDGVARTKEENGCSISKEEQSFLTSFEAEDQQQQQKQQEQRDEDSDNDDYDPLAVMSESDNKEEPDNETTVLTDVDVPLFNEIIKHFISMGLFNNSEFTNLTPVEKEKTVIKDYNNANNTNAKVRLNFAATTSYNKPKLRPNEQFQILVPINPFCLRPDISMPMPTEEFKAYESYLRDEDVSLKSGKWDNYPIGSRLFIGNLAVNSITKEDLFRIFHPYGEIKQVSLKQGFGFVQYATAEACSRAIEAEKNVPLHNKFMHLEVSKHQIQKAMEQKSSNSPSLAAASVVPAKRTRDDSGERKQGSEPAKKAEDKVEVKVITTTDSTPEFNNKLLKRLTKDGIILETEDSDVSVDDVPQELITSAAYNGVMGVFVTKDDSLNVMAYETTSDGGIKFDEYNDISIDDAIEIILSAKAKKFASEERPYLSKRSKSNDNKSERPKNANQLLYGTGNKKNGNKFGGGNSHAGRDRYGGKNQFRNQGYNKNNQRNQYPVHEAEYDQNYDKGYGQYPLQQQYDYTPQNPGYQQNQRQYPPPQQGYQPQHEQQQYPSQQYPPQQYPPQRYPAQQYPPNRYPQQQQQQQQQYPSNRYPPQQQQPQQYTPSQQYSTNGQYPNPQYPPGPPPNQTLPPTNQNLSNSQAEAAVLQTLQGMDSNTLQSMMHLLQQQQQQQQQVPSTNSRGPPHPNQRQQMYRTSPNQSGAQAALNGFLNQLQTSPAGANPPPPQQHTSSYSNTNNNNHLDKKSQQDQANDLFETLARLKNNM